MPKWEPREYKFEDDSSIPGPGRAGTWDVIRPCASQSALGAEKQSGQGQVVVKKPRDVELGKPSDATTRWLASHITEGQPRLPLLGPTNVHDYATPPALIWLKGGSDIRVEVFIRGLYLSDFRWGSVSKIRGRGPGNPKRKKTKNFRRSKEL